MTPFVVGLKPLHSLVEILQGIMVGPIAMRNTLYNRRIRICVRCGKVAAFIRNGTFFILSSL